MKWEIFIVLVHFDDPVEKKNIKGAWTRYNVHCTLNSAIGSISAVAKSSIECSATVSTSPFQFEF